MSSGLAILLQDISGSRSISWETALLPVMKELFDRGYVDSLLYRSFEEIEKQVSAPADPEDKWTLMNIFDRYIQVIITWAGYQEEEEEDLWGESGMAREAGGNKEQVPRVLKTGRNDPCPCGSGKKYKKCCMVL